VLGETDIAWRGFGFSWNHRRAYANVLEQAGDPGVLGNHWFLDDQPYVALGPDPDTLTVVFGPSSSKWFKSDGSGGWVNRFGGHDVLTHDSDADEYILTAPGGAQTIFYDGSGTVDPDLRYRLKGLRNPGGATATLDWSSGGQLRSITFADTDGSRTVLSYTYYTDFPRFGLLSAVLLTVDGRAVKRARYDYYVSGDTHGPDQTLRSAVVEEIDTLGAWLIVREQLYRYYKTTGSGAYLYGIKLMLGAEGVAAARRAGYDLDTASDDALAPYASHRFSFNSEGRVTSEILRGGEAEKTFTWLTASPAPGYDDVNTWYRRCVETRPDGSTYTVYTNRGASTLLDILTEPGTTPRQWCDFYEFNADYRLTLHATPAAVDSVTEPAGASDPLVVTLKSSAGLIEVRTYYAADDFPNGEVKGYLKSTGVKEGSGGTVAVTRKLTYDTRTVDGVSIHPVEEEFRYPVAGAPDVDAALTAYARTWHGSTFQVAQLTTTPPVIDTAGHGTGLAEPTYRVYDTAGFLIWEKDARGVIAWHAYDPATGAMIRRIDDADPALLPDPPAGWVAPSFGGVHLVTDYLTDDQGRTLRAIEPEHSAVVDGEAVEPCQPANVRAQTVRRVGYMAYFDSRHQTWSASGYVTGYGTAEESWHLLGPVSVDARDAADRTLDTIQARAACPCGALSLATFGPLDPANGLPDRLLWTRWSHTLRDLWGRETGRRDYFEIPPQNGSAGFEGTDYRLSTYGYDAMNRRDRMVSPDGTITRTVFDVRNEPTATWVGTDDTGATATDPGNGGADGNNLKPVALMIYDDGADGGNGNLTQERRPVDDTSGNDRVIDHDYDFRDRRVETSASDGTRLFITRTAFDNLDQPISQIGYHTSAVNANRTAFAETAFDLRGRPYEQKTWGVDPATGDLTETLIAGTWYDPNGNPIKTTPAGAKNAAKTDYDALNRAIAGYLVSPGTPASGQPANDVSTDTVVEQSETEYDRGGNVILQTRRERLPGATGTGPLGDPGSAEPKARRSYLAQWQDPIGRSRYTADYGTNGGAALARPDLPPAPSDTVVVSETRYAADGQPGSQIAPDGTISQTTRDRLGQPLRMVEALGTPAQRATRFRWHLSGQMSDLILENPATGEQVTAWLFGTNLATSGIARNDLVSGKIWPTGESESYSFNRQSDTIERTDPNGSVREFTYNKLGQPLDDAATTVASGVDATMRRVGTSYNDRGLRELITTYDAPTGGNVINEVKHEYDAFNQLIVDAQEHDGEVDGSTPEVTYTHTDGTDNILRRLSITAPSGKQVDLAYGAANSLDDVFNRVSSLKVNGESNNLADYVWAGFMRLASLTYPTPDAALSYVTPGAFNGDAGDPMTGYDRFGRTTRMPWQNGTSSDPLADIAYGYDRASRRTWRKDLTPASDAEFDRTYGYDALGQVKTANRGTLNLNQTGIGGIPQEAEAWQYDEQGNWLAYDKAEDGTSVIDQTRRSNQSNQIIAIDGTNEGVAYDRNGNMTRIPTGDALTGAPRKLVWNAWDQLVEVRDQATNSLIQRNAYDGLFRRTTCTLADSTVIHQYYNDQWKLIEERKDASTDPLNVYYWGARPGHRDDLIRRDRDTDGNGTLDETLWCLMDYFDPIAILNNTGSVLERYTYSAFGVPLILAPDYSTRSSSAFDWGFLFHGQFTDAETGYQNYGYRYYSSNIGQWIGRDAISENGGENLFSISENSLPNLTDLLGLFSVTDILDSGKDKALQLKNAITTKFSELSFSLQDWVKTESTALIERFGDTALTRGQYTVQARWKKSFSPAFEINGGSSFQIAADSECCVRIGGQFLFGGFTFKALAIRILGAYPIIEGQGSIYLYALWCKRNENWTGEDLDTGFRGQISGGLRWDLFKTPEWSLKLARRGANAFVEIGAYGSLVWSFTHDSIDIGGGVYARAVLDLIHRKSGSGVEEIDRHQASITYGSGDFVGS